MDDDKCPKVIIKCYSKNDWEVEIPGSFLHEDFRFKTARQAYLFAIQMTGFYSEWDRTEV